MGWLWRDPVRGVSWLNMDKFPYERGEDEVEVDFMVKGGVYSVLLVGGGLLLVEGGWVVYVLWLGINFLRRKG